MWKREPCLSLKTVQWEKLWLEETIKASSHQPWSCTCIWLFSHAIFTRDAGLNKTPKLQNNVQGTSLSPSSQEAGEKFFFYLGNSRQRRFMAKTWLELEKNTTSWISPPTKIRVPEICSTEGWLFTQCSFQIKHGGNQWKLKMHSRNWGAMKSEDCPCNAVLVNLDLSL